MLLPWLAEVGELTFWHADFNPALQALDPRHECDARFRPHAGKQAVADVQRAIPALQLNRTLLLIDLAVWRDAHQRAKALDLLLTLLVALVELLHLHLKRTRFTLCEVQP